MRSRARFLNFPALQAPSRVPTILLQNEAIVDTQIAHALRNFTSGNAMFPQYHAYLLRLSRIGKVPRLTQAQIHEVEGGIVNPVALSSARNSPEYSKVVEILQVHKVGGGRGFGDRRIVADAFFAQTVDGAVPWFLTADKGIYNALFRINGLVRRGLVLTDVRSPYYNGFKVSIRTGIGPVRTIFVVPVSAM